MTRLPRPPIAIRRHIRAMRKRWEQIEAHLEDIEGEYLFTYNVSYGSGSGGSFEAAGRPTGTSDLTGESAIGSRGPHDESASEGQRGRMKSACIDADDCLYTAASQVLAALNRLTKARGEKERDILAKKHQDAGGYPKTVTKDEFARMQQAQARRRGRGEGYGETVVPQAQGGEP